MCLCWSKLTALHAWKGKEQGGYLLPREATTYTRICSDTVYIGQITCMFMQCILEYYYWFFNVLAAFPRLASIFPASCPHVELSELPAGSGFIFSTQATNLTLGRKKNNRISWKTHQHPAQIDELHKFNTTAACYYSHFFCLRCLHSAALSHIATDAKTWRETCEPRAMFLPLCLIFCFRPRPTQKQEDWSSDTPSALVLICLLPHGSQDQRRMLLCPCAHRAITARTGLFSDLFIFLLLLYGRTWSKCKLLICKNIAWDWERDKWRTNALSVCRSVWPSLSVLSDIFNAACSCNSALMRR